MNNTSFNSRLTPTRALDQTHIFLDDGTSHYENELVSLDRFSGSFEEHSLNTVLEEPTALCEQVLNDAGNIQNGFFDSPASCLPEYFLPSSISSSADGESGAEESNSVESAKELFEDDPEPRSDESHTISKGKVSDLQRTALDAIFHITDRPSRCLVLYIASELRLHHVTVKNFFSNARRRVRRAAARLSDPERSKRENRKRKEKRRLAALTAAAWPSLDMAGNRSLKTSDGSRVPDIQQCSDTSNESPGLTKADQVSPRRRALMEKLADKVQRSAALRNLANSVDATAPATASLPHVDVGVVTTTDMFSTDSSLSPTNVALPFATTFRNDLANDCSIPPELKAPIFQGKLIPMQDTNSSSTPMEAFESPSFESPCDDRDSSLWHQNLLNVTLEYHPDSWDIPALY
ncbi:uncharacterized protein LOC108678845 [Hyalella azteca]|uniref:Uncharacterized protein LOC108678845 n=1 Tax=Hyalella azteca TaxID=294128 RepID=A0A8B7PC76_HYAAZ|nr:uncharacterized protein LOC108678845 [Hyalella azteca]XP_047736550.1 uncharacterized protein LOC108678845 [Hyalella azteca]